MSDKYAAYGAKLQYLDGATWTDIAGVRDISGPGFSADMIDVTSHSSASATREKIKSLIDAGELSFDLVWDPEDMTGQRILLNRMLTVSTSAVDAYRLVFKTTNSKTWQFNAVVSKFEPSNPVEGEISASVTLTITGLPTLDL